MKLEDMPKYIPLIKIKDNGCKNSKLRLFGNDIHDVLVVEEKNNYLYYYNLQCGESSHECSDFRFRTHKPTCVDDIFYSRFIDMVDLDKLIQDHDKEVRKQVCDEIRKFAYDTYKEFGVFDETDLEHILDQIEKGE